MLMPRTPLFLSLGRIHSVYAHAPDFEPQSDTKPEAEIVYQQVTMEGCESGIPYIHHGYPIPYISGAGANDPMMASDSLTCAVLPFQIPEGHESPGDA